MRVRKLKSEELTEASKVMWASFYAAEKDKTSLEGMTTFRDLVEPLSLQMNSFAGDVMFYGAFEGEKLVGAGALKDKKHVLLLYVLPQEQKRGVGSRLLTKLLSLTDEPDVTVNAAPDAVPFYEKNGFSAVAAPQIKDGIRFVPMIRKRTEKQSTGRDPAF